MDGRDKPNVNKKVFSLGNISQISASIDLITAGNSPGHRVVAAAAAAVANVVLL